MSPSEQKYNYVRDARDEAIAERDMWRLEAALWRGEKELIFPGEWSWASGTEYKALLLDGHKHFCWVERNTHYKWIQGKIVTWKVCSTDNAETVLAYGETDYFWQSMAAAEKAAKGQP